MSVHWTTHELDGLLYDPEPPDDDEGPWCYWPRDLWGQTATPYQLATMTTLKPPRRYL